MIAKMQTEHAIKIYQLTKNAERIFNDGFMILNQTPVSRLAIADVINMVLRLNKIVIRVSVNRDTNWISTPSKWFLKIVLLRVRYKNNFFLKIINR